MVKQLALVVREGPDAGNRAIAGVDMILIGRARTNDLVLRDPAVSRRHLEARAEDGQLFVRAADGAAPFVFRAESHRQARLVVGDALLVGDTWLVVVNVETPRVPPGNTTLQSASGTPPAMAPGLTARTDVRTLFDGASSEVRGLSALFQLTEALDDARDLENAHGAFQNFVSDHLPGAEVLFESLAGGAGLDAMGESPLVAEMSAAVEAPHAAVLEQKADGVTLLTLPTGVNHPATLAVRVVVAADALSNPLRRLLVVGARVFGSRLEQVRALATARHENESLRALAVGSARAFLGNSKAAEHVARVVPKLAAGDTCALLLGESGVGKTFVARLIHEAGPRAEAPLRVINCAAIPESLLEAELFGAERGAYTGAVAAREGAFEAAGNGTLLLDEIGELGLTGQAKLLRALEEKRFERLGGNRTLALRARVLAATNRDLAAMVEAGTFRRDLYFRISVITLRIPALRERGDDIRLLAERILADLLPGCARRVRGFSPAALAAIATYPWPGNVRELRNAIEHALVLGDGPFIEPSDLPETMTFAPPRAPAEDGATARLPMRLDELEDLDIQAALAATNGNRTRAAALLGINRVTLYKKLKEDPPA
ncbi:MAG: sigma 54-interacting transcriptional regulator [Polyangiaceae bacterium]